MTYFVLLVLLDELFQVKLALVVEVEVLALSLRLCADQRRNGRPVSSVNF